MNITITDWRAMERATVSRMTSMPTKPSSMMTMSISMIPRTTGRDMQVDTQQATISETEAQRETALP